MRGRDVRALAFTAIVAFALGGGGAAIVLSQASDDADVSISELTSVPGFAGVYFDRESGTLVVCASSNIDYFEDRIAEIDSGVPMKLSIVEFDLASADQVVRELRAGIAALEADGVAISAFGFEEPRNRVVVEVTSDVVTARALLEARFGGIVEVVAGRPYIELN